MLTFLPYPDFRQSLECLDRQRLGRQRLEARQIYEALTDENSVYRRVVRGPAVRMWQGHEEALAEYYDLSLTVWAERGYVNEKLKPLGIRDGATPPWLGAWRLHSNHRSQLLAKLPAHYGRFGWTEEPAAEPGTNYFWPVVN